MTLETRKLAIAPDATAPDGSEVRLLAAARRGSMAHFRLPAGSTSKAVAHRSVEEVWYFISGAGQMWRSFEGKDVVVDVGPGTSLTIPVGARFQFRAGDGTALEAIGVTMPPWPGMDEAYYVPGIW